MPTAIFAMETETQTGNGVIHSHLQDYISLTGMQTWKGATQLLLKYYTIIFFVSASIKQMLKKNQNFIRAMGSLFAIDHFWKP